MSNTAHDYDYDDNDETSFGPTIVKNKLTPKERMELKAGFFIGQLHGMIDDFNPKTDDIPDFYDFMRKNDVSGKTAQLVQEPFKGILSELLEVKELKRKWRTQKDTFTDAEMQLYEGYEYLSNKELQKLIDAYETIMTSSTAISENAKRTRKKPKARKKKGQPVSKIINKLKFMPEDTELMIQSENPEKIIGAKQLYVYNKVYNTVTLFFSETIDGLSVRGTSITNYAETKSLAYKLGRKPDIVKDILQYKTPSKAVESFRDLGLKETRLSARMNEKCLILKILG